MEIILKILERDGQENQRKQSLRRNFFLFIPVGLLYKGILSSGILAFVAAAGTDSVSYWYDVPKVFTNYNSSSELAKNATNEGLCRRLCTK